MEKFIEKQLNEFSNSINVYKNKTEELHSSILAAILNYPHDNYFIFRSFLKRADKASGNALNMFSELPVHSPSIEPEKSKVDISIEDNTYKIIIENKINGATDIHGQLARYIDGSVNGAHYLEKDVYIIYITNDKKTPNKHSWIRLDGKLIATDYKNDFCHRFVNITRNDICEWLEEDVLRFLEEDAEMHEFVNISLRYFRQEEITKEAFKGYKYYRKVNTDNRAANFKETIANWREILRSHYSDVISDINVTDSEVDIIFNCTPKQSKLSYKFGCRMEMDKKMEGYEKTFIRFGLYKIDDMPFFSKEFLTNLFNLFFNVDRYYDRYNNSFKILEDNRDYFAYKEVQLWSCSDYEFQFAFEYYLTDLIDKTIMFVIEPLQLGLINFSGTPDDSKEYGFSK